MICLMKFLMAASQKADCAFDVPPPSTAHTVADANRGIEKMTAHLIEKSAVKECDDRSTPAFSDPTDIGWKS